MSTLKPPDAVKQTPRHVIRNENVPASLCRSPRPYASEAKQQTSLAYLPSPAITPSPSDTEHHSLDPLQLSAAESGTEADDECLHARTLPAPPVRPRKGLRDGRGDEVLEPDLTPEPLPLPTSTWTNGNVQPKINADGRVATPRSDSEREKHTRRSRRRNAELRRRCAEVISLIWVAYIVCSEPAMSLIVRKWQRGMSC